MTPVPVFFARFAKFAKFAKFAAARGQVRDGDSGRRRPFLAVTDG
jgi:hypothetical protein